MRARRCELEESGVCIVIILAVAPQYSETYENVNQIMTKICFEALRNAFSKARISYAVDIKMALVLLDLKSACAHLACPYCLWLRCKKNSCSQDKRIFLGLTTEATALKQRLSDGN